MPGAETLVQQWRGHAALLRQYRNRQQAEWLEDRATELEAALQQQNSELLTLTQAAEGSGYFADHLGRLVREWRQGMITRHSLAPAHPGSRDAWRDSGTSPPFQEAILTRAVTPVSQHEQPPATAGAREARGSGGSHE